MISLLKEVGRGKRGARDLTYYEAARAADLILRGEASPAQIGAFLVAERIKMESIDEIQAFVDRLAAHAWRHPIAGSLDCAGPYDGRTKSFLATFPTAFVLTACGLPVALHASPTLPPKRGITLLDLVRSLGAGTDRERLIAAASQTGLLFVPTEEWCPPLARLRPLREELGLRTAFNSAEKLLRFSGADIIALGVFHGTVFEKMAQLITRLGFSSGIVVQGMEGSEDLPVTKRTRTLVVRGGTSELYIVDPELLELTGGIAAAATTATADAAAAPECGQEEAPAGRLAEENATAAEAAWTLKRQAEVSLAVLRGEADAVWSNTVLLNGAVRLWIAGAVPSVEDGLEQARRTLESGAALRQFERWIDAVR